MVHNGSSRVFLSIVNHYDFECHQIDIVAAFVIGDLEETIDMDPSECSEIPRSKVLRPYKSLYGLRQSPRYFNDAFDKWLQDRGFTATLADSCLYTRYSNDTSIMLSIHVDDQLIAGNFRPALDEFKLQLNAQIECPYSGPVNDFLGLNVHRDRPQRKLHIPQEHRVEALLDRFGLIDCNMCKIPQLSTRRPPGLVTILNPRSQSLAQTRPGSGVASGRFTPH